LLTSYSTTNKAGLNPPGNRNASDAGGAVAKAGDAATGTTEDKDKNAGFGLEHFDKDVKGSLKVHIKLDLDVDIHITARIKGDIAIGLL
jgi:hypothetical protein